MSGGDVAGILGAPVYEAPLTDGGTRRFYHDAVSMVATWRVDFGAGGRVQDFAPATTSIEFAEVVPGQWKKGDVLMKFGLPDRMEAVPGKSQSELIYHYQENGVRAAYMYITLDPDGTVIGTEAVPVFLRPSHR